MVATLLKLRLRILLNTLKKDTWRLVFTILGLLYAGGVVLAVGVGAFFLARSGIDLTTPAIAFGAVLTLGWVVVPLVAFGIDDTLDPARFTQFTTASKKLAIGLVVAGAMTIPGLLTLGALGALTLAWVSDPLATLAWVVAALIGIATCLTLARLVTTAAGTLLRSRRSKDALAIVGMVGLLGVVILPNLIEGAATAGLWESLQPALEILKWTPFGAAWAIPGAVVLGHYGQALVYLVVGIAWLGLIGGAWVRVLHPAMTTPPQVKVQAVKGDGSLRTVKRLQRLLGLPVAAAAVGARALRYWRSDPRYLSQALMVILIGPILGVALMLAPGFPPVALAVLPVAAAFFAGWALHNDTAYDSSALWFFIASGGRGRDDRLGRLVAFLIWALPALVVITTLAFVLSDQWQWAPAVFGGVLAIFGGGLGFSLGISGAVAYPVQPPGSSPFSTTGTGAMGYTILLQTVSMLATFVLALPALVAGILGIFLAPWWGWVALGIGVTTLIGALWGGVRVGGAYLDRRAPRLLASIRGWDGH